MAVEQNRLIRNKSGNTYEQVPDGEGIEVYDTSGLKRGRLTANDQSLVLTAETEDSTAYPLVLKASSVLIGGQDLSISYEGANVGDFLKIISTYEHDGETYFVIGYTPLDVVEKEESFSDGSTDLDLTASDQIIIQGTLTDSYVGERTQATCSGRIENTTNSDIEVEIFITTDSDPSTEIFTRNVPRKNSGNNGILDFSIQDSANGDIPIGAVLNCKCKSLSAVSAGDLFVSKVTTPVILEVFQNTAVNTQIQANTFSNVINVHSPSDLGTPIGGIYTLDTDYTVYEFSPSLMDLGSDRIVITGNGVLFTGLNQSISGIISTTTEDLLTVNTTFNVENIVFVGTGNAQCAIKASDLSTENLTVKNCSFIGFSVCGVSIDNYKSFIIHTALFSGMPTGIKFSNTANNTALNTILFEGITDYCIDLNGATTNAIDIESNTAMLPNGSTFLKVAPNGGNINVNGYGTIRANKIDTSLGGVGSEDYSPLDTEWLALGNNAIADSDRISPSGWGYYVDDAVSSIIAGSGDLNAIKLSVNGLASTSNSDYLPKVIRGISELWDTSTDDVLPITLGDSYNMRVAFTISSSSGNPQRINLILDIGGTSSISIPIASYSATLKNGTPQSHTFTIPYFTLGTFLSNGGQIFLYCDSGTATISNRSILIERISSGAS